MENLEKELLLQIDKLMSDLEKETDGKVVEFLPNKVRKSNGIKYKQIVQSIFNNIRKLDEDCEVDYIGNAVSDLLCTLNKEVKFVESLYEKAYISDKSWSTFINSMDEATDRIKKDISSVIEQIQEMKK